MNLLLRIANMPPRARHALEELLLAHPEVALEVEAHLEARESAIRNMDEAALRAAFEADKALIAKYLEEGIKAASALTV